MIQNVVLPALGRLAASLICVVLVVAPAMAGDRAQLNIIGFSENSQYIAFEEFGVQDGVGGYYSEIYVVDLAADSWVKGSPYSVMTDGENPNDTRSLAQVRKAVIDLAAPTIKALEIDVPAETLNLLPDGVPNMDGKTMVVDMPSCCGSDSVDNSVELRLTLKTFPSQMTGACQVDNALGFSLDVDYWDGTKKQVHKDGDTLPKSRRCPQDYRIYSVVAPFETGFENGFARVAFISSYPFDFEGVSRRFLVVPLEPVPSQASQ